MDISWSQLLQSLGVSALLIAALAWLARALVLEGLSREAFRLQEQLRQDTASALEEIRHRTAIELETFRHSLDLQLAEHGFRFGKLHDRRFQFIASLYAAIEAPVRSAVRYRFIGRSWLADDEERTIAELDNLRGLVETADKALAQARLYLPEELDSRIRALLQTVRGPLDSASLKVLIRKTQLSRKSSGLSWDPKPLDFVGIIADLQGLPRSTAILRDLARECRALLGVSSPEQPSQRDAG